MLNVLLCALFITTSIKTDLVHIILAKLLYDIGIGQDLAQQNLHVLSPIIPSVGMKSSKAEH